MPSARASPARASRSPSPTQPVAAPSGPVSCERVVNSTAAYLEGVPETLHTQCFADSYRVGKLEPNLGWRVGHSLVLSPDQRTLCVVGGLRLANAKAEHVAIYEETSPDDESDTDTAVPAAADEVAAAALMPVVPGNQANGTPEAKPSTARTASAPMRREANSRSQGGIVKRAPASASVTRAPATQTSPRRVVPSQSTGRLATAATARIQRRSDLPAPTSPTVAPSSPMCITGSTAPAKSTVLPAVPAEWCTQLPMVECLNLDKRIWFTPLGEQRRAAAIADAVSSTATDLEAAQGPHTGGGAIRWPSQSAAAVLWELRAAQGTAAALTSDPIVASPSSTQPANSPPATPVLAAAPVVAAPPAQTKPTTSRRRPPKAAKDATTGVSLPPLPAAAGEAGGATATAGGDGDGAVAAGLSAKEKTRERRRQYIVAKQAEEAARAEEKRRHRLEAQKQRDARWSVPLTDVVLLGGWEKGRRLPTTMTYHVDVPAETGSRADVVHSSLPIVEMLAAPQWQPVTGHTSTVVRDRCYVFGGHAAAGSTNDLYVFENGRLRASYEAAAQRAVAEETKRLNATLRSRNSITFGASSHIFEARDGLLSPGPHAEGRRLTDARSVLHDVCWSCTLIAGRRYEALMEANPPSLFPGSNGSVLMVTAEQSRVDVADDFGPTAVHSARPRGRPGSQNGPGGDASGRPSSASVSMVGGAPSMAVSAPAPPPRTSHCAASLANRFLIIFGGRQRVPTTAAGTSSGPGATSGPAGGGGGAKPGSSVRARGKSQAKGRHLADAAEDESALPTVTVLDDVAAFDTETRVWVQVRVSGAHSPSARYGAALCSLPFSPGGDRGRYPAAVAMRALNSPTTESAYAQRELFLHGGIDAAGNVLNDAWVLQATGKHTSWFLERDPKTGVSVLAMRWVSIRVELSVAQLLPQLSRPAEVIEDDALESVSGKRKRPASKRMSRSAFADTNKLLEAQLMDTKVCVLPRRAHHAVIATVHRDVFIVGGEEAPLKVSIDTTGVPDLTHLPAQLEQAVNERVQGGVYTLHVRPLENVEEVTVDRPRAKSKSRDKA